MKYPRLIRLRDDLRNWTNIPVGFVWDWDMCRQCAMGLLACQEGQETDNNMVAAIYKTTRILDIPWADTRNLFVGQQPSGSRLTPEDVADRIDAWLQRQK